MPFQHFGLKWPHRLYLQDRNEIISKQIVTSTSLSIYQAIDDIICINDYVYDNIKYFALTWRIAWNFVTNILSYMTYNFCISI